MTTRAVGEDLPNERIGFPSDSEWVCGLIWLGKRKARCRHQEEPNHLRSQGSIWRRAPDKRDQRALMTKWPGGDVLLCIRAPRGEGGPGDTPERTKAPWGHRAKWRGSAPGLGHRDAN